MKIKKIDIKRMLFLIILSLIFVFNINSTIRNTSSLIKIREKIPYNFLGHKFSGLENILRNQQYAGYYTDKDLDLTQNNMQFSQAQFVLAPTILDVNNAGHKFSIFDYSTEIGAFKNIKELGLIPLKKNNYGIILTTKNP